MTDDFWPSFEGFIPSRPPMSILNESANQLSDRTNSLVGGLVRQEDTEREEEKFIYSYYLSAPSLGNYKVEILSIVHPPEMYPLAIRVDSKIGDELGYFSSSWHQEKEVGGEEEFVNELKRIFETNRVKRLVGALISQAGGMRKPSKVRYEPEDSDDIPF